MPDIHLFHCLPGARAARGAVVIIDVFRAFTVAAFALANGAERILPVAGLDEAYALKAAHPDWLLMGERGCIKQPGFDFGNSPAEIEHADLSGRTLVHTTSAGTQGLAAAAEHADVLAAASFPTASATARWLRDSPHEIATLVAMGSEGKARSAEDDMCAIFIKNAAEEFPNRFDALRGFLRTIPSAAKFFDPAADYAPERDFELCLDLDRFDFVITASRDAEDRLQLTKSEAPAV